MAVKSVSPFQLPGQVSFGFLRRVIRELLRAHRGRRLPPKHPSLGRAQVRSWIAWIEAVFPSPSSSGWSPSLPAPRPPLSNPLPLPSAPSVCGNAERSLGRTAPGSRSNEPQGRGSSATDWLVRSANLPCSHCSGRVEPFRALPAGDPSHRRVRANAKRRPNSAPVFVAQGRLLSAVLCPGSADDGGSHRSLHVFSGPAKNEKHRERRGTDWQRVACPGQPLRPSQSSRCTQNGSFFSLTLVGNSTSLSNGRPRRRKNAGADALGTGMRDEWNAGSRPASEVAPTLFLCGPAARPERGFARGVGAANGRPRRDWPHERPCALLVDSNPGALVHLFRQATPFSLLACPLPR